MAKFVEFQMDNTYGGSGVGSIWINPDHVAAVYTERDQTVIMLSSTHWNTITVVGDVVWTMQKLRGEHE